MLAKARCLLGPAFQLRYRFALAALLPVLLSAGAPTAATAAGETGTSTKTICSGPLGSDFHYSCQVTVKNTLGEKQVTGSTHVARLSGLGVPVPDPCPLQPAANKSATCTFDFNPASAGAVEFRTIYSGDSNHDSSFGDATVVGFTQTTVGLQCNPNPVVEKHSTTCAARVSSSRPDPTGPTGSVDFTTSVSPVAPFASCALTGVGGGESVCSVNYVPPAEAFGDQTILAHYTGDANHFESSRSMTLGVLARHGVFVGVDCEALTLLKGRSTTCKVTAEDTNGARLKLEGPLLVFADAGGEFPNGNSCEAPAANPGKFECSFVYKASQVPPGANVTVAARKVEDTEHREGSGFEQIEVFEGPTKVGFSCVPSTVPLNQLTTCTATVAEVGALRAKPTGTVNFTTTSTKAAFLGGPSCELSGPGPTTSCSVAYKPEATGSDTLTAAYAGDEKHNPSEKSTTLTAIIDPTQTTIGCLPQVLHAGQSTVCTATVRDTGSPLTPTGSVKFGRTGQGDLSAEGRCSLVRIDAESSSCAVTYTPTAGPEGFGEHRLSASYVVDSSHATSADTTTVTQRATTAASLACEPGTLERGEASACVATVENAESTLGAPSGSVSFDRVGNGRFFPASSCTLHDDGGGLASCGVTYFPDNSPEGTGPHTIKAVYAGDLLHLGAEASKQLKVGDRTRATLSCLPGSVERGAAATCTATVDDVVATPSTPSGTAAFTTRSPGVFTGGGSCRLEPVVGNPGESSCAVEYVPQNSRDSIGPHPLKVVYGGDLAHLLAEGTATLTVERSRVETALSCLPSEVGQGGSSRCTASVTDRNPNPEASETPEGRIVFSHTAAGGFSPDRCDPQPAGQGRASCAVTYTPSALGNHQLTATYGGDADHGEGAGSASVRLLSPQEEEERRGDSHTGVRCAPPNLLIEGPSTCTATVTDLAGRSQPSGVVSFGSNASGAFTAGGRCELQPVDASSTACSVTYQPHAAGAHQVTGSYSGDAVHRQSSGSAGLRALAAKSSSNTSVNCAASKLPVNTGVICTVTVSDESADPLVPAGTVTLASNSQGFFSPEPGCVLAAADGRSASCRVGYVPSLAAVHTLTATFAGDALHSGGTGTFALTVEGGGVQPDPTSTELDCQPAPARRGQGSICVVTVEDAIGPTPTGIVAFANEGEGSFGPESCELHPLPGTPIGAGLGPASCQVEFTPSGSGNAPRRLTALYLGDVRFLFSRASTQLFVAHLTSTALSCDPAEREPGESAHCTVIVTDLASGGEASAPEPGSKVHFESDGAGAFSAVECEPLANPGGRSGSCSVDYTPAAASAGIHRLGARFDGDAGHETSAVPAPFPLWVSTGGSQKHSSSTALSCDPGSIVLGGGSACTVTVEDTGGAGTGEPGGQVTMTDGEGGHFANPCILASAGAGKAVCHTVYVPNGSGPRTLTATYSGDGEHEASSRQLGVQVQPARGGHESTAAVTCKPSPVTLGGAVVCTATVFDAAAVPNTPTGLVVMVSDGPGSFGSAGCSLFPDAAGSARCQVIYTPAALGTATHRISVLYSGDAGHEPALGATQLAVAASADGHGTATTLRCNPSPVALGAAAECTASVTDTATGATSPSGAVVFASDSAGAFSLGGCILEGGGPTRLCHVTYTPSAANSPHRITAIYAGDGAHEPSLGDVALSVGSQGTETGQRPPQSQPPTTPRVGTGPPTAPDTSFSKRPKLPGKKTAKRKVRVAFTATVPGSSFECKLDRKRFKPCKSPFKVKVRPGAHVLRVRAVSPRGVADPTPAVLRWRVIGAAQPKAAAPSH